MKNPGNKNPDLSGRVNRAGNLVLLAFSLSLLISPFGARDAFLPTIKAAARESYHAAVNMGHTSALAVKSVVERAANKKSFD